VNEDSAVVVKGGGAVCSMRSGLNDDHTSDACESTALDVVESKPATPPETALEVQIADEIHVCLSALQRLLTLAAGGRTHARRHQAAVGP
jgi:hypothetical protein